MCKYYYGDNIVPKMLIYLLTLVKFINIPTSFSFITGVRYKTDNIYVTLKKNVETKIILQVLDLPVKLNKNYIYTERF